MQVKAHHKNARMSPRKLRLLREALIGVPAAQAKAQLQFLPGKAAQVLGKVLQSAVANAVHNFELKEDTLTVADVVVDGALSFKRYQPRSKGMANKIIKRTSHVTVVVDDGSKKQAATGKKTAIDTITVDDAVQQDVQAAEEEVENTSDEPKPATPTTVPASQREQASSKIKTMQQGGDKTKTHRRKSIGD